MLKPARLISCFLICIAMLSGVAPACGQSVPAVNQVSSAQTNPQPAPTITLPAGTKILVVLKSALHTTSAESGSGIYSEMASVVVQEGRVVVPLKAQVQGVVESSKRPGRVKGRAQFLLHFTSLTFPNNYTIPMDGALQSVPGSPKLRATT